MFTTSTHNTQQMNWMDILLRRAFTTIHLSSVGHGRVGFYYKMGGRIWFRWAFLLHTCYERDGADPYVDLLYLTLNNRIDANLASDARSDCWIIESGIIGYKRVDIIVFVRRMSRSSLR